MEKETKRKIKKIKKKLKTFQKLAKSEQKASIDLIPVIKQEIKELLLLEDLQEDKKLLLKFKGIGEGFDLYIKSINDLNKFKEKWD